MQRMLLRLAVYPSLQHLLRDYHNLPLITSPHILSRGTTNTLSLPQSRGTTNTLSLPQSRGPTNTLTLPQSRGRNCKTHWFTSLHILSQRRALRTYPWQIICTSVLSRGKDICEVKNRLHSIAKKNSAKLFVV